MIFYFDTFGTGIYDNYFPDVLNFTNLWPYNEKMDNIIDILISPDGYPQLISALLALGLTPNEFKDFFTNEFSVWNANNWQLEPGKMISYQVNNYSITALDSFSPFYENNFTIDALIPLPELVSGISFSGSTPEMALTSDNESWVIESSEKFLRQELEINFVFKNDTKIDFVNNTLESISIILNFTTMDDLEALDFEIYNFSVEEFQDIESYIESNTNDSWTFTFINTNKTLDWLFYPGDNENYTVLFKISAFDSEPFNISIDDLDIKFLSRDININEDTGARLGYGSANGKVQYERRSNSILLSTYDAASIITYSYLSNYSLQPGENNTYSIYFKNIGSCNAKNITISLLIPGIIIDDNDFILKESNLTFYLPELLPSEDKTINFTFQVPNSFSIKAVSIDYENSEAIERGNSSKLQSLTNEVYLSALIDYEENFPYLRTLEIKYNTDSTNFAPEIGESFNLTVSLKNTSPEEVGIPDLAIIMNDKFGGLKNLNNSTLVFEDIGYDETQYIKILLEKVGWKGYYYPPINFIKSSEGRTIQIAKSMPKIIGIINFSITKSVNKKQIEIGEKMYVQVELENTGSITIKDLRINDIISYSQSDFSLVNGKLVNLMNALEPGEKVVIDYTIRAKRQGSTILKPASIMFYYLAAIEQKSNAVHVKIIIPINRQVLIVLLPILSVFAISVVYMWQNKKYKKKKREFRRSEMLIFNLSSRETILKVEHTLRERLSILSKPVQEEYPIESKRNGGISNE
jgi:archaellum component FlaG (FlaF/FlaG flagellin family)